MQGSRPDLHLIILSATIDSSIFSAYFDVDDLKVIDIPNAENFPIETLFLEDALLHTDYVPEDADDYDEQSGGYSDASSESDPEARQMSDSESGEEKTGLYAYPSSVRIAMKMMNWEKVDPKFVFALVSYIVSQPAKAESPNRAILIFVSGAFPLSQILEFLDQNLRPRKKFVLFPLHSQLSIEEQRACFL